LLLHQMSRSWPLVTEDYGIYVRDVRDETNFKSFLGRAMPIAEPKSEGNVFRAVEKMPSRNGNESGPRRGSLAE
jgi:hypothetical protein